MNGATEATAERVVSSDGTEIAWWTSGEGPPLVLVHGSLCDHSHFDPLVAELREGMTTVSMDRRGFGASGDAAGYDLEREFEDVAAVVEAVAGHAGEPVALFGHSYGAGCAMGAAALTGAVPRLVLYEPGLGISYPSGSIEEIEAAVAAGDLDTAALLVLFDPARFPTVTRVGAEGVRAAARGRRVHRGLGPRELRVRAAPAPGRD